MRWPFVTPWKLYFVKLSNIAGHMGSLWVLYDTAGFSPHYGIGHIFLYFFNSDEYFSIFFSIITIGNMEICATRQ